MANLHGGPGDGQAFRTEIKDVLVVVEEEKIEYKIGEEIEPIGKAPKQHLYHLLARETVGRQAHYYWEGLYRKAKEPVEGREGMA